MNENQLYLTFCLLLLSILSGCATNVPNAVQEVPAEVLSVAQVQQQVDQYLGKDVRWGGDIIFLENAADYTDVAVLATTLSSKGKPDVEGGLDARFIARVAGFLDPAEYAEGRRLTVTGVISGMETRLVGEYPYTYPLVQVQAHHLWPKEKPRVNNYYYGDPFYDPWPWYGYGRWGRYPYWRW